MTIELELQSGGTIYINAAHIIYVLPVDEGCQVFLSNDKSFWSTSSVKTVNSRIISAYRYIHKA